jgi:hypothetical protein
MTYREAIQSQIEKLEALYDNAGSLRDYSYGVTEKAAWNKVRTLTRDLSHTLQRLDNSIEEGRAKMPLNGNY